MNLSALSFFRNLRTNNKQFAVLGLGRFGRAVCGTLHSMGYEVLGADADEKRVAQVLIDQIAAHAVRLDSTDPSALKEAGIFELDTAIVAIGNYIQESVITTLNLKEAGVPYVVAKASSEIHVKLLKCVGANHVVFPEHEMGCMLARSLAPDLSGSLTKPSILERFELDPDNSIVEIIVPQEFDTKTIAELELLHRYGLNVLAISQDNKFEINPAPNKRLQKGMAMVVIGSNKDINRLPI